MAHGNSTILVLRWKDRDHRLFKLSWLLDNWARCKIWGFHCGDYEVWSLLGCYVVLPLLVTANVVPSSPILVTVLMVVLIRSSETSVLTGATLCDIPEDDVLQLSSLLAVGFCFLMTRNRLTLLSPYPSFAFPFSSLLPNDLSPHTVIESYIPEDLGYCKILDWGLWTLTRTVTFSMQCVIQVCALIH
jgi:hypothetical protein